MEHGVGETRAVRIVAGEIVEARILLDGIERTGTRLKARIRDIHPRAIAESGGREYLLPKGAAGTTEGAEVVIEVTRESIPGAEPWKRPLARLTDQSAGPAAAMDATPLSLPFSADPLGEAGWEELIDEARTGIVRFSGGELRLSPTPAMTLIDVDGYLPPAELALAGATAAAKAILRLDVGGSIGIDLPTVAGNAARQAVGEAIDRVLPKPFERTAMNGFGFIQIVRPRKRASILELAQDRAKFEARALLRRAAFEPAGAKRLVGHPALISALETHPQWLEQLSRQVGGAIGLRADGALPMSAGYAESI